MAGSSPVKSHSAGLRHQSHCHPNEWSPQRETEADAGSALLSHRPWRPPMFASFLLGRRQGEAAVSYGDLPRALPLDECFHISSPLRHMLLQFVTYRKSRCDLKSIGGFKVGFLGRCSRTAVKSKALDSHSGLCPLPTPGGPRQTAPPHLAIVACSVN